MIKLCLVAAVLLTPAFLFAEGEADGSDPLAPKTFAAPAEADQLQGKIPDDLVVKRFYLNMNPGEVKSVIRKDDRNREILDRFDTAKMNHKPVVLPISSIVEASVHPYFSTSFMLPPGSVISYAEASEEAEVLKHDQNILTYRPKKDFSVCNITVVYSLNGKNQLINLLLRRFDEKELKGDQINLIYAFRDIQKLDDLKVIEIYAKEYGYLPKKKFNYIYIDDMLYRIVKDDKYGDIMIAGNKYRVDNGVIHK